MNKQKGLAPILIVLLIALAVGGYLIYTNFRQKIVNVYYSNNRNKTVSQSSPSPITVPIASSSAETTNWKTYTNTKYDYLIKYPQSAEIVINDKAGENDIKFIPKSYLIPGTYESPGLVLMVNEVDKSTIDFLRNSKNNNLPKRFGNEALKGGQSIYFVTGGQKQLTASCGTNGERSVLDMCNRIIVTLRFP